jgi:ABC-type Co2+ transport system permease subunit
MHIPDVYLGPATCVVGFIANDPCLDNCFKHCQEDTKHKTDTPLGNRCGCQFCDCDV